MKTEAIEPRSLFEEYELEDVEDSKWRVREFSADNFCEQLERLKLEEKYWPILEVTDKFNRQSVSFQLSKNDNLHGWLKYKEGFSAELVRMFLKEFDTPKNALVMDPFMGSGTTALVSILSGMDALGFDILPMSKISIMAKSKIFEYDLEEIKRLYQLIASNQMPADYNRSTNFVNITADAYPAKNPYEIEYFTALVKTSSFSTLTINLFTLCALNSLEKVSYSAKDGQYLRWDYRCPKIVEANKARVAAGKAPFVVRLDKGEIPSFQTAVLADLRRVISDIFAIRKSSKLKLSNQCTFVEGSALFKITDVPSDTVSAVISSPPYCNRYDYTRTYALELAYLGMGEEDIRRLRQELLSCTVENKSKLERLKEFYHSIGRDDDTIRILQILRDCEPLNEIMAALQKRAVQGEINNKGVIRMVEGYFSELAFLFYEIYRVCKEGASVAFVNDNVRYAGEVIPVDFLTTALAEAVGFKPVKIYALKQQKGNSSQQMKKYGRVALRKSITVWKK